MAVRLLVSVRNAAEAKAAADAGADIIDVKEPDRGSLGFADPSVIADVCRTINSRCPVSAALGEYSDWYQSCGPPPAKGDILSGCAQQLTYVKLGLAGILQPRLAQMAVADRVKSVAQSATADGCSAWTPSWLQARHAIQHRLGWKISGESSPAWVAVAYADSSSAAAPSPEDVLSAAIQTGCAGLLIDTFDKSAGTTFDWMTEEQLRGLRHHVRKAGLFFALAGRIGRNNLSAIKGVAPDIVAVRGAVCGGGDRRGTISGERVAAFRQALLD